MKQAQYAIIRYLGDFARNEPVNIGIVAWFEGKATVQFSPQALGRVLHQNPTLPLDAFDGYQDAVGNELVSRWPADDSLVHDYLRTYFQLPETVSTPIPALIRDDQSLGDELHHAELQALTTRMLQRLVDIRRRQPQERHDSPMTQLSKALALLIAEKRVYTNHEITLEVPRTIDFFLNGGINAGIDVLDLRTSMDEERIVGIADALANKTSKFREAAEISSMALYVPVDRDPDWALHVATFESVLRPAEVDIVKSVAEAKARFEGLAETRSAF
jgi:hypothetical protein